MPLVEQDMILPSKDLELVGQIEVYTKSVGLEPCLIAHVLTHSMLATDLYSSISYTIGIILSQSECALFPSD